MCVVGGRHRQDDFGVGCELDFARSASTVCQRYAADLAVILAGNQNVHDRRQRAVAAGEFGVILGKDDFVVVSIAPDWLHPRRSDTRSGGQECVMTFRSRWSP